MSVKHSGRRCIVGGCSNTTQNNVSLHKFPLKDSKLTASWNRFVRIRRADWKEPSQHSAICSAHFIDSFYEMQFALKSKFGLKTKRQLKEGSTPSIQPKRKSEVEDDVAVLAKKPRGAYTKREKARVSKPLGFIFIILKTFQ